MSSSPAKILSDLLSTQGLGSTAGTTTSWRICTGRQPDAPDSSLTVYDTGGFQPRNPAYRVNYATLQVRARGVANDYDGTWSKLNDVCEFLNGLTPQMLQDNNFSGVIMQSDIQFLSYDGENRPQFVANFRAFIEPNADSSAQMHRQSL